MKLYRGLVLASAMTLLLTSCEVTSENPLSSPATAQPDPKLVGRWHEKGAKDEILEFTVKDAHTMRLEDRKRNQPSESYDVFVSIIGGHHFLNARHIDNDDPSGATKSDYFIVRYEVSDHILTTWWLDQDKVAEAINSGRLQGVVRQDKDSSKAGHPAHSDVDVTLRDSGRNLANFIRRNSVDALFSDKSSELYR
jgi:hypothetical protein